jgi:hypothetical protein
LTSSCHGSAPAWSLCFAKPTFCFSAKNLASVVFQKASFEHSLLLISQKPFSQPQLTI